MLRIASIHYSSYPLDTRPRREAEALVEAGMSVDVICLRYGEQTLEENVNGVRVHRIPMQKDRSGKMIYVRQYFSFLLRSFLTLSLLHLRNRYNIVHVHNMPDFLVFAALLPKLSGSKIVLDLHDPMPELYMTKYSMRNDSAMIRLLKLLERWSIKFADIVLTPNIAFRNLFISRGCPAEKIHIIMNSPMENVFLKDTGKVANDTHDMSDKFVIMFHGGVYERHGLDTALEAIATLKDKIPNIKFKVFGDGDYTTQFLKLVDQYDLNGIVSYHGVVTLETIAQEVRTTDLGIIPNRKSPFTDINFPVRIFEYLCLDKPVIVPKTRGILDYFDEDSIYFFEGGNAERLAAAILRVYQDQERRCEVLERGKKVYDKFRWELQKKEFVAEVTALVGDTP